jgi:hypothetical protein
MHAVSAGGEEELNQAMLELEFTAAGAYVPGRPNIPRLDQDGISVAGGRDLSCAAIYDPQDEKGAATKVQLFLRAPSASYDYTSPAAEATLAAEGAIKSAALAYTVPANGRYYARILAATAAGTQSDPALAPETEIYVSDVNLPAPTGAAAYLSRG